MEPFILKMNKRDDVSDHAKLYRYNQPKIMNTYIQTASGESGDRGEMGFHSFLAPGSLGRSKIVL